MAERASSTLEKALRGMRRVRGVGSVEKVRRLKPGEWAKVSPQLARRALGEELPKAGWEKMVVGWRELGKWFVSNVAGSYEVRRYE